MYRYYFIREDVISIWIRKENAIIYYTDDDIIIIVITQSLWFLFVKGARSFVMLDSDEDKC